MAQWVRSFCSQSSGHNGIGSNHAGLSTNQTAVSSIPHHHRPDSTWLCNDLDEKLISIHQYHVSWWWSLTLQTEHLLWFTWERYCTEGDWCLILLIFPPSNTKFTKAPILSRYQLLPTRFTGNDSVSVSSPGLRVIPVRSNVAPQLQHPLLPVTCISGILALLMYMIQIANNSIECVYIFLGEKRPLESDIPL